MAIDLHQDTRTWFEGPAERTSDLPTAIRDIMFEPEYSDYLEEVKKLVMLWR